MSAEEIAAECARWLALRSKKCTYVELRDSAMHTSDSLVAPFDLTAENVEEVLTAILDSAAQQCQGRERTFYLFAWREKGDGKHESRYILRWGAGTAGKGEDEGTVKAIVGELRNVVKDQNTVLLDMHRLMIDQTRAVGDACTNALKESTRQLQEYQKDNWRVNEAIRAIAEDKRGEKREEAQVQQDKERTRIGGEILAMLAPVVISKFQPGAIASTELSGDTAVGALMRTFSEEQRRCLVETGILRLSTEQMTGALGLVSEIRASGGNGSIKSPLLRGLAAWLSTLSPDQTSAVAMGEVQLTQDQAAAFLELYVACAERAQSREGARAVS